jgi:hypothetical protein
LLVGKVRVKLLSHAGDGATEPISFCELSVALSTQLDQTVAHKRSVRDLYSIGCGIGHYRTLGGILRICVTKVLSKM